GPGVEHVAPDRYGIAGLGALYPDRDVVVAVQLDCIELRPCQAATRKRRRSRQREGLALEADVGETRLAFARRIGEFADGGDSRPLRPADPWHRDAGFGEVGAEAPIVSKTRESDLDRTGEERIQTGHDEP